MNREGNSQPLLSVHELRTDFGHGNGSVRAVDGISFSISRGECLAVVGESGCGKTMTALSLTQLLPADAHIVSGEAVLNGVELIGLSESAMREVRAQHISMMFQDPMTCLNPSMRVDRQIVEGVVSSRAEGRESALERGSDLLRKTGILDVEGVLHSYPHQLSGGMRQRAIFAMTLLSKPEVLIADEPTTAVDATTQEQILDLIETFKEEWGLAVLMITHDLGAVARIADSVLVMYAGRPAEYGPVDAVFGQPMHPYTRGLINSVDLGRYMQRSRLDAIEGVPPSLDAIPAGCAFHPRCKYAIERCRIERPEFKPLLGHNQSVACHVAEAGNLPPWARKDRGGLDHDLS